MMTGHPTLPSRSLRRAASGPLSAAPTAVVAVFAFMACMAALAGCATAPPTPAAAVEAVPESVACPQGLPEATPALRDPIAFVELEHRFRQTMRAAGTAERLLQAYTEDNEHSYLSDPVYPAALQALQAWHEGGSKPTQQSVADTCAAAQAAFGPGCLRVVGFEPPPLDARVAPRLRP